MDHINMDVHGKLSSALGHPAIIDIGADAARLRMVKSKEEIEVIKIGAATADVGGHACREVRMGTP